MLKKRVLLVDDSAAIRGGVRGLFNAHPNLQVIGEAEHGHAAVEMASSLRPDLIILDLSMPIMSGLEAAPLLLKILPNAWLILFTAHDVPELRRLARAAGIHAVVLKSNADRLGPQAEALMS